MNDTSTILQTNIPISDSDLAQAEDKENKIIGAFLIQAATVLGLDRFSVALYDRRTVTLKFFECYTSAEKTATDWLSEKTEHGRKIVEAARASARNERFEPAEFVPDYFFKFANNAELFATQTAFRDWLEKNKLSYREPNIQVNSWLAVPLRAGGVTLAVVIAQDSLREHAFDKRARETLNAMAERAAAALANARQMERLQAINQVGQHIAASVRLRFDTRRTLEEIYLQGGRLMDTSSMYVAIYNEAKGKLAFPLAYVKGKREEKEWESQEINFEIRNSWTATKEVVAIGKPLTIDYYEEYYANKGWEIREEPPPKSWLGVPLMSGNKVLGVISLQNDEINGLFGQDDVDVLQAMANQAAIAIANARLVENMRTVSEVGKQLTAGIELDEEEILDLIHETASNLMDTRDMYIALYKEDWGILEFPLFYLNGKRGDWPAAPMDLKDREHWTLTKEVFDTKQSLNVPDFETWYIKNGYPLPDAKPYPKSWLGVPLVSRDKVAGIISLQNDEIEAAFGHDDVEILEIIAGQAAVAIENARLYETQEQRVRERTQQLEQAKQELEQRNQQLERTTKQLEHRNQQLEVLQEIGVQITSQLELEDVLGSIAESMNQITRSDFCTLFSYDSSKNEFGQGVRRGTVQTKPSIPSSDGFAAEIAATQHSKYVEDVAKQETVSLTFIKNKKIQSFAVIPLIAAKKTVGVLFANYRRAHKFDDDEKKLIGLLANQAAVAIENAKLYQQLNLALGKIAETQTILTRENIAIDFVHRLNNLAGTIPIWVENIREYLEEQVKTDQKLGKYLNNIDKDIEGLLREAKRLKQPPQEELIDVVSILNSLVRQVKIQTDQSVEVIDDIDTELPLVRAIAIEFPIALRNIVENSLDAMPEGGFLTISAKRLPDVRQDMLQIKISDTGTGIPEELQDFIFTPFFSTKDERQHMGYGLWRAKQIFEKIGGSIECTSKFGKGTTFTIILPLTEESQRNDTEINGTHIDC